MKLHYWFPLLLIALALCIDAGQSQAQAPAEEPPAGSGFGLLNDLDGFGGPGDFGAEATELKLSGTLTIQEGSRDGVLEIHADLAPGWHVYALTQKDGPGPSEISAAPKDKIQLLGVFEPNHAPESRKVDVFDVPLLEHYGKVTWKAPVRLAEGIDPKSVALDVQFNGLACHDESGCIPMDDKPIDIKFAGYTAPPAAKPEPSVPAALPAIADYRADRSQVVLRGYVSPATIKPGGTLQLVVTAICDPQWHIYAYAPTDPVEIAKPTLFALTQPAGWTLGTPQPSSQPTVKAEEGQAPVAYHSGEVTWTVDIQVPADAAPGQVQLSGLMGYQACTDISCDRPLGAEFRVPVSIGAVTSGGQIPLQFSDSRYSEAAKAATEAAESGSAPAVVVTDDPDESQPTASDSPSETPAAPASEKVTADFWAKVFDKFEFTETEDGWKHAYLPLPALTLGSLKFVAVVMALLASFMAGMVLNVMPCVLPVIGLKLMSFINQGGQARWRVFSLNIWYSVGMWVVFMIFAIVAAVLHLLGETFAWGEHLGDPRFSIPLLLLVFTLGLSMFGVWEIPIPGFAGGGKANDLAAKEGPAGAFFKGILTTVLATPCSGPFIGVAVGIAVIAPLWLNFSMFTAMALGMASPYLLIGAFPGLIKWLPKPGEWMETFKEFMGFILMGTGIWIIYFQESRFVIPVLTLLTAVGASCWIVGRTSITATHGTRLRNWAWAVVFAGCGLILFKTLLPPPTDDVAAMRVPNADSPELPWEPFTPDRLQQYRDKQATVMVDFTADW